MTLKGSLLIRGGTVVDPARDFVGRGDVLICGNTCMEVAAGETADAEEIVEADGCLVMPGLIDNHTHCFYGGSELGFLPDPSLLPMGVTAAVDQGSAGIANCDSFMQTVVNHSQVRVFCNLHVSPTGLVTERYSENVDPQYYGLERLRELFRQYAGRIVGLKVRQGQEMVGEFGLAPLKAAVQLAGELGCRVTVHTANPPGDVAELVALLRPGDVFCHCFHGRGSTILDENGKVRQEVRAARENGVLFDTADARIHHSYPVIKAALADGFFPDIISTDLTRASLFGNMVFGLPAVMSKYLSLGLPLPEVVRACTAAPAELLGLSGKLGTLATGAFADVAIFQLTDTPFRYTNRMGETFCGNQLLVPKMTILNGKIMFRQIDFPF
ncbi:MAG: metallo-dependent hydrolase [Negativicutes bacterium]|nr:metallo-dependent hydrolase [Negativicutes bacterium]